MKVIIYLASLLVIHPHLIHVFSMPMNDGHFPYNVHGWNAYHEKHRTSPTADFLDLSLAARRPPRYAPEEEAYYLPPSPSDWSLGNQQPFHAPAMGQSQDAQPSSRDTQLTQLKAITRRPFSASASRAQRNREPEWPSLVPEGKYLAYESFLTHYMEHRGLTSSASKGQLYRRLGAKIRDAIEATALTGQDGRRSPMAWLAKDYFSNPKVRTGLLTRREERPV
jgi:hypothetical protein